MSSKNDKSLDLIEELRQTHSIIGYEQTKSAIIKARDIGDQNRNQHLLAAYIFKECCNTFRCSQNDINKGKTKGTRTDCLMVIFAMYKKHLEYSNETIGKLRGKSCTVVTRAIGRFNALNGNDKITVGIIAKAKKINDSILIYKTNLYQ